jgi:hypothetical protein
MRTSFAGKRRKTAHAAWLTIDAEEESFCNRLSRLHKGKKKKRLLPER